VVKTDPRPSRGDAAEPGIALAVTPRQERILWLLPDGGPVVRYSREARAG